MSMFWTFVIALIIGYILGHYIRPNRRVRARLKEIREKYVAFLEEGNKGVYRTIITDHNKSSELVVEIKELAITEQGQVKVEYLSAFYKNPEFRNKKGSALLKEVHGLLGDYLPANEIEWFDTSQRNEKISQKLNSLESTYKNFLK